MKTVRVAGLITLLIICSGCEKDPLVISPLDMLDGKKWYLEKRSRRDTQDTINFSYLGLPTFWFSLQRDNEDSSYMDSDGYVGRYQVEQSATALLLKIFDLNRGIAQSYRIVYVGYDYLVVEYDINQYVQLLYFSSRL
jgi:hypothetical protein